MIISLLEVDSNSVNLPSFIFNYRLVFDGHRITLFPIAVMKRKKLSVRTSNAGYSYSSVYKPFPTQTHCLESSDTI